MSFKMGLLIKSHRERLGLSAKEASVKLDITPTYLSMLENNVKPLSSKIKRNVIRAYGLNADVFEFEKDSSKIIETLTKEAEHLSSAEFLVLAMNVYETKLGKEEGLG